MRRRAATAILAVEWSGFACTVFISLTTRLRQAGAIAFDCEQTRNPGLA
jgi:hypothetical protein